MAESSALTLFQNHNLDSNVNVQSHYVEIKEDGTFTKSTPESATSVFFTCHDLVSNKKWVTVEIHIDSISIHGTVNIFKPSAAEAYNLPSKDEIVRNIKLFLDNHKKNQTILFGE